MSATTASAGVIGRDHEISAVEKFLDLLTTGPAAVVLTGDPGIGKSTVWRAAVSRARLRSYQILLCRPAEAEAGLALISLADLLHGLPDSAFAALPDPQREALRVALRRAAASERLDRVALARGALAAVSSAASSGPTVLAIDDAQWLDPASRDALRFVFRRLVGGERVGLLATVRGDEGVPLQVDAALPAERVMRVELGPLSSAQVERVVRGRRDVEFPPPTWRAIHRVSAGNPFSALEIADAVAREGRLRPGDEPPLPESVTAAVRDRLACLTPAARRLLLHTSAAGVPTLALLQATGTSATTVEETVAADVLEREGERLRFTHPLLAAAVYGDASSDERRHVHRRLADLVDDPEERAVHLGRGSDVPDETVAAALEVAADRAAQRGVPETAAELAEHARRLTPSSAGEDAVRRAIQAARYCGRAGDTGRSGDDLRRLVATLPAGRSRAGALALLGFIDQDPPTLLQAIEEAQGDPRLLAAVHADAAKTELHRGDRRRSLDHARAAVAAARQSGDPAALTKALTAQALPDAHGRAEQSLALLEQATRLERTLEEPLSLINSPSTWRGAVLLNADRFCEARQALEDAHQRGLALGHASRAVPLTYLVELECRTGDYESALARSLEAQTLWAGGRGVRWTLVGRALVDSQRGDVDGARAAGLRSLELTEHDVITRARTEAALGSLELSLGDFAAALTRLADLVALPDGEPLRDAVAARGAADAVEALLGLGRPAEAKELADRLEERARHDRLPSGLAAAARCRALVLAQHGDLPAARTAIADAYAVHRHHREPFEHARTLLAAGSIERRAKRKAEARAALAQARSIFEQLGARLWCERTTVQLERVGLRRTAGGDLSAAERRVAELAAGGATNKEIAAALFMSVKTVEAHLSRVYGKFGVRSRTELASRFSPTSPP